MSASLSLQYKTEFSKMSGREKVGILQCCRCLFHANDVHPHCEQVFLSEMR